jgi:hypothetical protein
MHVSYINKIVVFLGTPSNSDVQVYEPPPPSSTRFIDEDDYHIFLNSNGKFRFLP